MKIAVIGATGTVGRTMLRVLEERDFPVSELIVAASERSAGKTLEFKGKAHTVVTLDKAVAAKPDIALFSAGGDISRKWAPRFADVGTTVIDNSSAWRMDLDKKLVVPEINAGSLTSSDKIIANPNCSTIQMVLAPHPLHERYGIKRVVVSTYQSVSGTGVKALQQLENEQKGMPGKPAYPHPIHQNALPHCDVFEENGYTKEEMKLVRETRKILDAPDIAVTATAVRVPVVGGHSEAVNVEFKEDFDLEEVRKILSDAPSITLQDDPATATYPMPVLAHGKDDVFVGRLRRDNSQHNTLNMWIVSDNLRKGAATNAVQIAEHLAF